MKDGLMMALKEIVSNGKSLLLTLECFFYLPSVDEPEPTDT